MIKILLSSAISALAVFTIMSFGASGQTPKPLSKSQAVVQDVWESTNQLYADQSFSSTQVLSAAGYVKIYRSNADRRSDNILSTPIELRSLVMAQALAERDCARYIEYADTVWGVDMFVDCRNSIERTILMLFDKAAEHGVNVVLD